ncbi:MAG: hypothetical protein M3Y08_20875 [Fibrobacterota bacterium]|nr:hypothetical protein [Fibrobacterota bacterium]
MSDMLDALLSALPDAVYYEQRDFGADVREKLRASDVPFAGYLRGAAVWDLAAQPTYPVYSITKTNTEDNAEIYVGYGSAVLSSVETGELLVLPINDESGKMPEIDEAKPARAPSKRPRAKTYSVDDYWRTFTAEDLGGGHGVYQAFLRAGNFQSQPYRFKAIPRVTPPPIRPFETSLKSKGLPGKGEFGIQGATFTMVPESMTPGVTGLTLVHKAPRTEHGVRHYPVHGNFRFAGEWPKNYERMPLHFLIGVKGERDLSFNTLWLPREKVQFKDGFYSGHFSFDLGDLFIAPGDGKSKPPKEAWIGVVHRGWSGPIVKTELP